MVSNRLVWFVLTPYDDPNASLMKQQCYENRWLLKGLSPDLKSLSDNDGQEVCPHQKQCSFWFNVGCWGIVIDLIQTCK